MKVTLWALLAVVAGCLPLVSVIGLGYLARWLTKRDSKDYPLSLR